MVRWIRNKWYQFQNAMYYQEMIDARKKFNNGDIPKEYYSKILIECSKKILSNLVKMQ